MSVQALRPLFEQWKGGFKIWRVYFSEQPPHHTVRQAFLEFFYKFWVGVAGEYHLLGGLGQGINCVNQFLLDTLLTGEEMYVIHQEDVYLPILMTEAFNLSTFKGLDKLIGPVFGRHVYCL